MLYFNICLHLFDQPCVLKSTADPDQHKDPATICPSSLFKWSLRGSRLCESGPLHFGWKKVFPQTNRLTQQDIIIIPKLSGLSKVGEAC